MRDLIRRYLIDNYKVIESDVNAALGTDTAAKFIRDAETFGSYPYYPGNQIADVNGWATRDNPGAYDGCPPGDEDDE